MASESGRVGQGPSVAQRREALHEAVLAAAEARVAASGLADLGVREIAHDAGCSLGMVYKLFASHDALVLAVNARTLAALGTAGAAGLRGMDDPAGPGRTGDAGAALRAMADAYLGYATENTPRWDALFAHRMAGGTALPDWYAALRDRMFAELAASIGAVAPEAAAVPGDFVRTLFSAVHGVVALGLQQKVAAVSPDELRAGLRELVTVIARGLAPVPPGR